MYAPNCAEFVNGVCSKCSFRFIRAFDNTCEPVNPLCASWDTNGACLTCYAGYTICESGCIMTESCADSGTYDPNCRNTVNGVCQECSVGYYFNQNGICTQVNPFCRTSNQGNCLSCYAGYSLSMGNCTVSINPAIDNPYCTRWENGVCQSCSRFSWNNGTNCIAFDPMCAQSDPRSGNCLACYSGYLLNSGKCVLNTNTRPSDLLCRRWNSAGVCVECSPYSFSRQNMCVAVDALCRTFDRVNGYCLSCYAGYSLQSGRCVVIPPDAGYQNTNRYCSVWDGSNCRQCANNTYFNSNGICTPVNPNCSSSSMLGQCLSCYTGYLLRSNNCVIDNTTINVGNALCSKWSGLNCQECSTRSYSMNGICTAVNTLCNTWDRTSGRCLTCYNGYILNGITCIINSQAVSNNPLCKTFDGPRCIECANRAYFVGDMCRAVDNSCATWSSLNGQCQSCYNGFALQGGLCVALPVPPAPSVNLDLYCARTD